ncbi:MAG: SpoIID/LytB domain-containing protein [Acidimicrobiia bacterium]|nr:SpoIID/LytB domain-containing protein [Acidimicrobiia bacterium]
MVRQLFIAFLAGVFLMAPAVAGAEERVEVVALVPDEGERIVFGGRTYAGVITVRATNGVLVVTEVVDLDGYLGGIREVPFSWPEEALEAQAVAARTYLAWTLNRGRAGNGARYGFDICATTACQVYAGTGLVDRPSGEPWLDAVAATAGEILIYDGSPAQTLYSSSSGPRTRSVEDIWGGTPKPYLVAVDSAEEDATPYWQWSVELPVDAVTRILAEDGYRVGGDIREVEVQQTEDGGGIWRLAVETERGSVAVPNTTVRNAFNRHGTTLYPGLLPANRPTGGTWPQAILSYTFDVELLAPDGPSLPAPLIALLPPDDTPEDAVVVFEGTGWGHGVGMSQWGAKAMADQGFTHEEILAHYYGGLEPETSDEFVPDDVVVGLGWGGLEETFAATGVFELWANGVRVDAFGPGEWTMRLLSNGIAVIPPAGVSDPRLGNRRWPR